MWVLNVCLRFEQVQYAKDREVGAKMAAMLKDRQQLDWLKDIVLKVGPLPC